MANEAFALSPISARATQPSDEDYDAISEAFMETARGRWFLGEYAKRNRNADTRMVLDAVARIEQGLAAQKQPTSDARLAEALASLCVALDEAKAATSAAFDSFALEENLAPVRKGIRVIREISWRWREIGADGRICDLIDQQINAIETSCSHIASTDPRTALHAAFDLIGNRLAELDDRDEAPGEAVAAASPSEAASPPSPDETRAAATAEAEIVTGEGDAALGAQASGQRGTAATARASEATGEPADAADEAASGAATEVAEKATEIAETAAEVAEAATEVAETAMQTADVATDATDMTTEAADAHDDAVLDMIAAEMAAPDASDADFDADSGDMDFADPPWHGHEAAAVTHEPRETPVMAAAQPSIPPLSQAYPETLREPSLGSTLIANGIVRRPVAAANDPLAPIRRLSQAEKIALFS